jgi:hypothetical protein
LTTTLILLYFLAVLIITIRIYQLKFAKTDFDTYGHLYFSKQLKVNRLGPFGPIPVNVIGAKPIYNPFFWNWFLVNMLGLKPLIKFQKFINSGLDIVFASLVYFLLKLAGYSQEISLMVVLFYLSCPLWAMLGNSTPRLRSFTPRLFSEIGVMLYFFFLYVDLNIPFVWVLFLATVIAFAVVASSKFGLQAIVFISLVTAIIDFSFTPIIPLVISLIAALIVSKGSFLGLLKHQMNHLKWYFTVNRNGDIPTSTRSSLSGVWDPQMGVMRNIYNIIFFRATKKGILAGSILIPFMLPLIILGIVYYNEFWKQPFSAPVLASIVVYSLINLRSLLFLGESERYLNHMAILLALSFVLLAEETNNMWLLYVTLLCGLIIIMNNIRIFNARVKGGSQISVNDEITSYLKTIPKRNIICFPYHTGSYFKILLETDHMLFGSILTDLKTHPIKQRGLESKYPLMNLGRLDEMSRDFGVNLIVLNRTQLHNLNLTEWSPPEGWNEICKISKDISLFEKVD